MTDSDAVARTIAATIHGRYLVRPATPGAAATLIVGFHGYGESADTQLQRLQGLPHASSFHLASVQGLHRFYRGRTSDVVASWMTSQDRELMIADNLLYVDSIVDELARVLVVAPPIVYAGFSQGVAMAFRSACRASASPAAVVAVGGDIPPEIGPDALGQASAILLARGREDDLYPRRLFERDIERLSGAAAVFTAHEVDGGHEWMAELATIVADFIETLT